MKLKIKMRSNLPGVQMIMRKKGLDKDGAVQRFHTQNVCNRIGKYMQKQTKTMATKLKMVKSPTEIIVLGPYAKMQYYGKVMIDPKINAAGFMTPEGWRSRRGSVKVVTDRNLKPTDKSTGPYWDRRLIAAEGEAMKEDIRQFVKKRK